MATTVVLTCAGRSGRWNRHAGVLKQLAPINRAGENILSHKIRLLRSNGVNDIYIATDKPEIRNAGLDAEIITPASCRWATQTILSTRHVWGDRTIVVHGDVYLSENAVSTILDDTADIRFYGIDFESAPVRWLGRRAEIFALAFKKPHSDTVARALTLNSVLAGIRDASPHRRFWMPARLLHLLRLRPAEFGLTESRLDLLKILFRNYSPRPPEAISWMRLPPAQFWRFYRFLFFRPSHKRLHGKLWGVYMVLGNIDPYGGKGGSWPMAPNPLFTEVNDTTQDCDTPADYLRLLFTLKLCGQKDALDWAGIIPQENGDR